MKMEGEQWMGGVAGVRRGKASHFLKATSCSTTRSLLLLFCIILLLTGTPFMSLLVEAHHILAVDLGVDWAKAATLGGGSGASLIPTIVLNDQANRKSPQCIAFRFLPYDTDDILQRVERFFSEQAQSLEPRFPDQVVCGPSLLAGRGVSRVVTDGNNTGGVTQGSNNKDTLSLDEVASLTFSVVPHSSRDKVTVRILGGKNKSVLEFSTEELIGMFFAYLKRIAERGLNGEPLRHLVVTVSAHASLAQRQTFVDAAAVAGLRAVRLVHGTTAAAVQLAHLNIEQFFSSAREQGPKYIMVYDMGGRRTEVAVYEFAPSRQRLGTITLRTAIVNNTLGGRAFDRCIARYIEREHFPKARPKAIEPVLGVSKPAARKAAVSLMRAVQNARERLSVNQEAPVVVQGVQEGDSGDFTTIISRAVFEQECAHLFDEAVRLRDEAIAQTKGIVSSVRELTRFEVIGGATRMPKLLERLSDGYGRAVDRTLNSDEAAVVGASYMGAARANIPIRGFAVVEPLMNDVWFSLTPLLQDPRDAAAPPRNSTRHLIFPKGSTILPAVRSLQLKNRTADFTLTLEDESGHFTRATFIRGVNESIIAAQLLPQSLRASDGAGKKRKERLSLEHTEVMLEVTATESGIPFVSNAYLHATYLKVTVAKEPTDTVQNESNAGSAAGENATDAEAPNGTEKSSKLQQPDEYPGEEQEGQQQRDLGGEEKWDERQEKAVEEEGEEERKENYNVSDQSSEKESNTSEATAPRAEDKSAEKEIVERVVRSFPLSLVSVPLSVGVNLNKLEAAAARDRLYAFQRVDDERLMRSALRNDIETLILHYKSLDAWDKAVENEGEANWREVVKEVEQWLDDTSDNVEISELQRQQQRMNKLQIGGATTG
ncbi:putative heat shock protein 70 (hsp70) [Trypanosoma cruzi]|uniref:Heat shock protein 70 (HSP70), putative n=2 Tax=Trypanosoma cruzi TaxID=5693 RepID=Q4E0G9_TRYCC|nr:heat shock protein 70 (HSP70), putative [Trypanosoma cruzi]EAN98261.1 heat shock protein 70 (HSP70), putative [Trypanosoma cruzi]PWV14622.1 putative heat shock protein 70 (hsp70) [Trypanosoma cruzi]RNC47994.1 putative heat shock protein 70 (hsp70) [Trypanosoma cruzi]|eukprot:XP_820112.1 heat shock protein 70 (HSP70) [Trypanosoma cruzi strain CL Brener]